MKIFVDADACPVKQPILKVAKEFDIDVIMYIDTSHMLNLNCEVITVDKANDSVDFAILNRAVKNDVAVTQDYGLASLLLLKKVHVINQNGFWYTEDNINGLLLNRYISKKIRSGGGRMPSIKKREHSDNMQFEKSFRELLRFVIDKNNE